MAFGPFCLQTPECPQHRFLTLPLSSLDFPPACCGSGLRLWLAGSPLTPAVSSSSSYGRVLHLQLLPTSPHGNAVSFGFRPENVCLKRTCTSLTIRAFRRTSRPFRDWTYLFILPRTDVLGYSQAVPANAGTHSSRGHRNHLQTTNLPLLSQQPGLAMQGSAFVCLTKSKDKFPLIRSFGQL
jgi:hypothetical protein